jgi:hypothetical protein
MMRFLGVLDGHPFGLLAQNPIVSVEPSQIGINQRTLVTDIGPVFETGATASPTKTRRIGFRALRDCRTVSRASIDIEGTNHRKRSSLACSVIAVRPQRKRGRKTLAAPPVGNQTGCAMAKSLSNANGAGSSPPRALIVTCWTGIKA